MKVTLELDLPDFEALALDRRGAVEEILTREATVIGSVLVTRELIPPPRKSRKPRSK